MHEEILNSSQKTLLSFLKSFSKDFGLVGGTAIALHIGHRQSIDFDLFSGKEFDNFSLQRSILRKKKIQQVFVDQMGEYTILIDGVKITFFQYPFPLEFLETLDGFLPMADLLTLSALKAYALGRRAKWKDYVDLYFVMKDFFSLQNIVKKAEEIFREQFNEKIFRIQLAYFKDLDFSENIIYMKGYEREDAIIQKSLVEHSLS